jgi:CspA family cold shock protein
MEEGTIIFYSEMRGFGFIAPKNHGDDVLLGSSALEEAGISSLNPGDKVSYNLQRSKGKICAIDLKIEQEQK